MSDSLYDRGRVTIVDDDAVIRRLMRLWLEADGYEVVELATGQEAAEHDTRGSAMICLDLTLDDMPGIAVLEHLRARDPDLPVVVVTGDQDLATVEDAMRAGAYDYIVKPFDQGRLRHAVRRAIERRQLTSNVQKLKHELDELRLTSPVPVSAAVSDSDERDGDGANGSPGMAEPLDDGSILNLRELERRAITRALEVSGGSVGKAAKLLGIGRATLYRRLSEQREPSRENGIAGHHDIHHH